MGKHRVEALSDGVFAVAMTLLVFGFKTNSTLPASTLRWQLVHLWPQLLAYILSFVIVGVYWVAHHSLFHFVTRVDRALLWLNNVFLMTVAFIPFPASLLGQFSDSQATITLYGCTLIVANFFLGMTWVYASRADLLNPAVSGRFRRFAVRITLAPIAVYVIAIAMSFVSPVIPLALFAAVPAFFIVPHRFVARQVESAIDESSVVKSQSADTTA
jgi:uncharacterized membrane protein